MHFGSQPPEPQPELDPYASGPPWTPRLTALLVNADAGAFTLSCVRSLRREWAASGYEASRLEVVVVQNGGTTDQRPYLELLAAEGTRVIGTPSPASHAIAVQTALENSSGDEDDLVVVLSPYLVFLPGSVSRVVEYMSSHPDCGLCGPRTYFDEGKTFQHPALAIPTGTSEVLTLAAEISPLVGRMVARSHTSDCVEWWTTRTPVESDMLSSGCLFVSRQLIQELGFLFDPSFPFGFEDADLCRRVKSRGRWIVYLPKAEVVLHGLEAEPQVSFDGADLERRYEASRTAYYLRYLRALPRMLARRLESRLAARSPYERVRAIHPLADLGRHHHPFELEFPPPGDWILELSSSPQWFHSLGTFAEAGAWQFPPKAWARLARGVHYLRVLDFRTRQLAAAYRFEKMSEARQLPIPVNAPGHMPSVRQHWPTDDLSQAG